MKPAFFEKEAKAELAEAAAWYERRRPGLGRQFLAAVDDAISRISRNPSLGSRYGTARCAYFLVRRFPYVVYYSEGEEVVRVIAIATAAQPGYWQSSEAK